MSGPLKLEIKPAQYRIGAEDHNGYTIRGTAASLRALIAGLSLKAKQGDAAMITITGHGEQVFDIELIGEPDHKPETLVIEDPRLALLRKLVNVPDLLRFIAQQGNDDDDVHALCDFLKQFEETT